MEKALGEEHSRTEFNRVETFDRFRRALMVTLRSRLGDDSVDPHEVVALWFTELADKGLLTELANHPADEVDVLGDVGWLLYRLKTDVELGGLIPDTMNLARLKGLGGAEERFCRLLALWVARFSLDHQMMRVLLSKMERDFRTDDPTPAYMRLFSRCSSEGIEGLSGIENLLSRAVIEVHPDKMLHVALQALWMTPVRDEHASRSVAKLMRRVESLFSDEERLSSIVHYRMSRERVLEGDFQGAVQRLDSAIRSTSDSALVETFIRERSMLVLSLDVMGRFAIASESEIAAILASTDNIQKRFDAKVDSAIAFNVQLILSLGVIAGVGGAAFGFGSSLFSKALDDSLISINQLLLYFFVAFGGFTAVSLAVLVAIGRGFRGIRGGSTPS